MKYKVGDKVRVRDDIRNGDILGGYGITDTMEQMRGEVVTISEVSCDAYRLEEMRYYWTDEMFSGLVIDVEPIQEPEPNPTPRYKVGDKVRIRRDLEAGDYNQCWCTPSMANLAGRVVTILRCVAGEDLFAIRVPEDAEGVEPDWYWSTSMFEGLAEPYTTPSEPAPQVCEDLFDFLF